MTTVDSPVAALVLICLLNSISRGHGGKGNKNFGDVDALHFVKIEKDKIDFIGSVEMQL